ncbi:MAG: cation:proton antiporter [Bacteroidetes bacterium]|nr:cation:proton antiporter [Bacteroidota bacterium]
MGGDYRPSRQKRAGKHCMDGLVFFHKLLIILGFSIPVIYLFNKLKFPSIIGFLITGIIIGPFGLKFITDTAGIQLMAEIGVALLLFTIGIEISLSRFLKHLSEFLLTGGLQVFFTFLAGFFIGLVFQMSLPQAVFLGFILAHSSSALVLKMLKDRDDAEAPQGRVSIGVILFQDIMVVPMMLLVPFLAGESGQTSVAVIWKLAKSILIIAAILVAARYIIPFLLERLAYMQMRDVFVITSIVITLGIAWLTHALGLSLAIGAFLAGLAISDTDFTHQIISDINPFRDIFLSIFFVSFGMILDLEFALKNYTFILAVSFLIILLKAAIVFGLVKFLKYPWRTAFLSGVILSQIGEFSFVLALQGFKSNIISEYTYQTFISASVLTFIVSPLFIALAYHILNGKRFFIPEQTIAPREQQMKNHVIVCGLGLNGRNLASVLKETSINYVIIDLNIQHIRDMQKRGETNIIWGDCSNTEILKRAGVEKARVLVIAISDRFLTKCSLSVAKSLNPHIHVIVRTKYVADIEELQALGADDIIPEEFETSIQIFSRVLKMFHIPNSIILAQGTVIRNKSYGVFRQVRFTQEAFDQISQVLAQGTIDTCYIAPGNPNIGKSIKKLT